LDINHPGTIEITDKRKMVLWNIDAYNCAIIRKDTASGETLYNQNKDPASNKNMFPPVSR